jgi:serine/threonine protein kinase
MMFSNQDIPVIPWNELTLEKFIGNGSLGDVHQGSWQGKEVAIKVLQVKTLPSHLKDLGKELKILGQCQSPFVLGLYGICMEADHGAVVMEYMSNGSLYHVLHQQVIPEQHRWQIAIDIAKGLAYLHGQQILHRDLKSQNILLDNNYRAKISDFDLAKLRLETSTMVGITNANRSTAIRWRAPELCQPKAIATPASDIYSYGMILWELCSKRLPFQDAPDEQTVIRWLNQGKKESIPENCPSAWRSVIEACWNAQNHRPTAKQVVAALEA